MDSNVYRLREFFKSSDNRSLIVDASAGLSLGALPGLEHFSEAVQPLLPLFDGVVTGPGQARRLSRRTRADAALLVRADWTNARRGPDFVLPPESIHYLPLLDPPGALDLGASALVSTFLLGFEEGIEAACLRQTVQLALQGEQAGLPLLVDVQPAGPRVVLLDKAIELGVSYALESGADGIAIPWPGRDSLENILTMAAGTPLWIKPDQPDRLPFELDEALRRGLAGVWLAEALFDRPDPGEILSSLAARLHAPAPAGPV